MRYVIPSLPILLLKCVWEVTEGGKSWIIRLLSYDIFREVDNALAQHLSYLTNDDLSLNANTISDASKTQRKYLYVTRVSVRVSIKRNISPKITLVPQ